MKILHTADCLGKRIGKKIRNYLLFDAKLKIKANTSKLPTLPRVLNPWEG